MLVAKLLLVLTISALSTVDGDLETANKTDLYLQVQLSDEYGYPLHKIAIDIALDAISKNSTVLPNYNLKTTDVIKSQCKVTPAVRGFIDHLNNDKKREIMIIGSDCSESSVALASLSPNYELVQISPASTSPQLTDTRAYKYFLRTVPSDVAMTTGIVKLMEKFNWKYLSILTEEQDLFLKMKDEMSKKLMNTKGLHLGPSESFVSGAPESAVKKLQETSARVIFLNVYAKNAIKILCEAYTLEMMYPQYAWITFGWYREIFWANSSKQVPCSEENLLKAISMLIVLDLYPGRPDNDSTVFIGNMTKAEYVEKFRVKYREASGNDDISEYPYNLSTFGYDATWLAALALTRSEDKIHHLASFGNNGTYAQKIYSNALEVQFEGASGNVVLTKEGDRSPDTKFYQYYAPPGCPPKRKLLGYLDKADVYIDSESGFKPFNGGKPPLTDVIQTIYLPLFVIFVAFSVAGIVFACVCLVFNLLFRHKETIKLSSPYLNIAFILGCVMWYILVIVYALDYGLVGEGGYKIICSLILWMAIITFTLIFGSIMAKAFRVHYIFRNLKFGHDVRLQRKIKEWHAFAVIGILLLVDVFFLLTVTAIPPTLLRASITTDKSGSLPVQVYFCTSEYVEVWLSILLAYKVLEVIICLLFAYEVRKIRVKELNDSKLIIFSVYAFVISIFALVPLIFTLQQKPNIFYGIAGAVSLLAVTILLGINFIPKMYSLYKDPSGKVKLDFSNLAQSQVTSTMKKKQVKNSEMNITSPGAISPVHVNSISPKTNSTGTIMMSTV